MPPPGVSAALFAMVELLMVSVPPLRRAIAPPLPPPPAPSVALLPVRLEFRMVVLPPAADPTAPPDTLALLLVNVQPLMVSAPSVCIQTAPPSPPELLLVNLQLISETISSYMRLAAPLSSRVAPGVAQALHFS